MSRQGFSATSRAYRPDRRNSRSCGYADQGVAEALAETGKDILDEEAQPLVGAVAAIAGQPLDLARQVAGGGLCVDVHLQERETHRPRRGAALPVGSRARPRSGGRTRRGRRAPG